MLERLLYLPRMRLTWVFDLTAVSCFVHPVSLMMIKTLAVTGLAGQPAMMTPLLTGHSSHW